MLWPGALRAAREHCAPLAAGLPSLPAGAGAGAGTEAGAGSAGFVDSVAFAPSGLLFSGGPDRAVKVWDAPSFPRHDIAFAMALQPRLGAGCLASELDPEVVKLIGEQFTGRAGLGVARLDVIILWQ